jgi:hypothetical protein
MAMLVQTSPMRKIWIFLSAFLLLSLLGCGEVEPRYHFEDMGKFKFPASFVQTEYYCSSDIEHVRGRMAPADAKAIVNANSAFRPDVEERGLIRLNPAAYTSKYTLRKQDADRTALMHIDIQSGEFDGSVTFYGSSVRRPAEKPFGS